MPSLLVRHLIRKATNNLKSWEQGRYDTYTLVVAIPAVRIHDDTRERMVPPEFKTTVGSLSDIQASGERIWFVIDDYLVELEEFKRKYALPNRIRVAVQDEWVLQPGTVLNIGIASDLGVKGNGGGTQAEFVFGSPPPHPQGARDSQERS